MREIVTLSPTPPPRGYATVWLYTEQAYTGLPVNVLPKIVLTLELLAVFVRY